ncbi:Hypothetical Protein FCC1311_055862 [Hondaea fermentalgiana]|uniref:EF-hand domain-containing protein n=1 Tax=Hondaea fermentalgiana TaxID=2315210 RepID=A0A2R5GNC1_9STRA|nr:Hypothetical Protein FCC1311_055862 [Hondaea fermentalgiana]|eukprot:GBG29364.1 Hypothetical Protein FCC1311_055862 [Hondaea fermentalgiana]
MATFRVPEGLGFHSSRHFDNRSQDTNGRRLEKGIRGVPTVTGKQFLNRGAMNDTRGSTIAQMIHRFRTSEPTDPATRKRSASRLIEDGEGNADADDDDEYTWQQPGPLSPRSRQKAGRGFRGVETLDDLIARDVEELAAARLSLDMSGRESRRSPRRQRRDRVQSNERPGGLVEYRKLNDVSGDSDFEHALRADVDVAASDSESDDSDSDDDDEVIVHEMHPDGISSKSSSPRKVTVALEDPMAAQSMRSAIDAARRKMRDLEKIVVITHDDDDDVEDDDNDANEDAKEEGLREENETADRPIFRVRTSASRNVSQEARDRATSSASVATITSDLEAAMYAFSIHRGNTFEDGRNGEMEPDSAQALSPSLQQPNTDESEQDLPSPQVDQSDDDARGIELLRAELLSQEARNNVKGFAVHDMSESSRPWKTSMRALAAERPGQYPKEFQHVLAGTEDHESILQILERGKATDASGEMNEAARLSISSAAALRSAYGRDASHAANIAEDLDVALLCLKKRLGADGAQGKQSLRSTKKTKEIDGELLTMKEQVVAKLAAQLRSSNDEGLPPLPDDLDESIDLLTARLRLANDFERDPARLRAWRSSTVDAVALGPAYEALQNAFDARDWNGDGLICVEDARRLLEDFAQWSGQPLTLTDEHVLKACGLLELSSQHLNFADLVKAFDVFVPAPAAARQAAQGEHHHMQHTQHREQEMPYESHQTARVRSKAHSFEEEQRRESPFSRRESPNPAREEPTPGHFPSKAAGGDDDARSVASSISIRVGPQEIRELAARLRRAQSYFEEEDDDDDDDKGTLVSDESGDHVRVRQVRVPEEWSNAGATRRPMRRQRTASPAESFVMPSAPTIAQAPLRVPEGQILLDLATLQSAVQDATIEFYKRRLDREHEQEKQTLPSPSPMVEPAAPSMREYRASPPNDRLSERRDAERNRDFRLEYDESGAGGRVRVRPAEEPIEVRRVARPTSAPEKPADPSADAESGKHFNVHMERLRLARSQVAEFEALRKRQTRHLSLSSVRVGP